MARLYEGEQQIKMIASNLIARRVIMCMLMILALAVISNLLGGG